MTKDTQPMSINRRDLIIAGAAVAAGFLIGKHNKQLEGLFDEKPLYSPETGHMVRPPFLEFFNQYGLEILGHPISEATPGNGKQYFQNLIVEWGRTDYYSNIPGRPKADGVNSRFFVYPLGWTVFFRSQHPDEPIIAQPPAVGEYNLDKSLEEFYKKHGGMEIFGYPVAEPFIAGENTTMQFLTNSVLTYSPDTKIVATSRLAEWYYQVQMPEVEKNQPWFKSVEQKN